MFTRPGVFWCQQQFLVQSDSDHSKSITLIAALTAVLTTSLRSLTRSLCRETLAAKCFLDLLCGLELCMCGFELGVILDIYDTPVYCVYLWLVLVWQVSSLHQDMATSASYDH